MKTWAKMGGVLGLLCTSLLFLSSQDGGRWAREKDENNLYNQRENRLEEEWIQARLRHRCHQPKCSQAENE